MQRYEKICLQNNFLFNVKQKNVKNHLQILKKLQMVLNLKL